MTIVRNSERSARGVLPLLVLVAVTACLDDGASHVALRPDLPASVDVASEAGLDEVEALDTREAAGSDVRVDGAPGDADGQASLQLAVTAITPHKGLTAGGEAVELTGSGLVEGIEVFFGEKRAPAVVVQELAVCTVYTPPHAPGAVDVRVVRGDGAEAVLPSGFLYLNAVEVHHVEPASGRVTGGEPVTVRGRGLVPGTRLYVGGHAALSVAVLDDATLVARTPPGNAGPADVLVANGQGQALVPGAFVFVEPPRLLALAPAFGPVTGGGTTRAFGAGLTADATWRFGDEVATALDVAGVGEALLAVPPGAAGAVDVTVTTAEGTATLASGYVYDDQASSSVQLVTSEPDRGPLEGGTVVWLATRGVDVATAGVTFGSIAADVLGVDASTGLMRVKTPAGAAPATVDVALVAPAGTATLPGGWTWEAGPRVQAIEPAWGPAAGGTPVRISGSGLAGEGLEVLFGTELAADVQPAADGGVLAMTPPAAPGKVDVRVRVAGIEAGLPHGYEYRGAFEVVALTPASGSQAGGTEVRVLGAGFADADPVGLTIGERACTHVDVVDDGLIVARTPPNVAGTYDVALFAGAATALLPGGFTTFDPGSAFGGTWGGDVHGDVNVTVLNGSDGTPLPDAFVLLGTDPATPYQGFTDAAGQITFSGPDVHGDQMVSASKACFSASSIVDYDAANAMLFLLPTCGGGGSSGGVQPGIVSGTVYGIDKMIVVPPGRCSNKSLADGTCAPCVDDTGCPPAYACEQVGTDGRYCLPPCFAPADCPDGFACVSMTGGELHCLPKKGRREVRCSTSWPSAFDWIGGQQLDPGPGAVADEAGYYRIQTHLGQLAVVCAGGIVDADWGTFEPLIIGAHRHIDPLPGEELPGNDVVLTTPLDGTLTARLEDPPTGVPGPEANLVFAFLDLGSDGLWSDSIDADALTFDAAPMELTGLPREFVADLYDASFTLFGAAISLTDNATPQSSVVLPGVKGSSDDLVVRFDGSLVQVEGSGLAHSLYAVAGAASDDLLAVGEGGLIAHFDGQAWGAQYAGSHATLHDVWVPATGEAWAAGDAGTLLHFTGGTWTAVALPTSVALRTVAVAPDGLRVVAGDWVVLVDDGTGWRSDPGSLWGDWHDAASDGQRLWLVGDYGRVVSYESGAWTSWPGDWSTWNGVWAASPEVAFVVGDEGALARWDGLAWAPMESGTTADLYAVSGSGPDDVTAVGDAGTVLHFDGTNWTRVDVGEALESLRGIALFEDRRGLAVGLHEVVIGPFVAVPRIVTPADGGVLSDLVLAWTAEGGLDIQATYVVVSVPTLFGPVPVWDLMVDPAVTTVALPDLPAIEGTPGLSPGPYLLRLLRLHRPGMDVDGYDLFDLDPTRWRAWSILETSFTR